MRTRILKEAQKIELKLVFDLWRAERSKVKKFEEISNTSLTRFIECYIINR